MTDNQAKEWTMERMLGHGFQDFAVQIYAIVNAGLTPVVIMDTGAKSMGYPKLNTLGEAWHTYLDCARKSRTVKLVGTMRSV